MARKIEKEFSGTSFHGEVVSVSVQDLIQAFGSPNYSHNTGEDKVNFEWCMETEDGELFTIYDWKEGRPLGLEETVEWHIGSYVSTQGQAEKEILEVLALATKFSKF
jgi:hypothetical protein